jgi:membrane protein YqaA with SNARE-associated domain
MEKAPSLSWGERISRFSVLHGSKRSAIFALALVSIGDFFIPALPTQTSVVALGLLQPKRAAWIALAFALSAALGAAILALLLISVESFAQQFASEQLGNEWARITAFIQTYGSWAVLLGSIFPTPPRLLTAATLLSGVSPWVVIGAIFLGKLIWFGLFLTLLIKLPNLLGRIPVIGKAASRFRSYQANILNEEAKKRSSL